MVRIEVNTTPKTYKPFEHVTNTILFETDTGRHGIAYGSNWFIFPMSGEPSRTFQGYGGHAGETIAPHIRPLPKGATITLTQE